MPDAPRKIKILFVSHSAQIAGGEVCLIHLVRHLDKDRFEPVVVFPTEGPAKQEIERMGVRTHLSPLEWWVRVPLGKNPRRLFNRLYRSAVGAITTDPEIAFTSVGMARRVDALKRIIEHERPDIVHTNTTTIWESALAACLMRVPHIWHVHEIWSNNPGHETILPLALTRRVVGDLSARVAVVSEAVKRSLADAIELGKLLTIHNGVDATTLEAEAKAGQDAPLRAELGWPPDTVIATCVGSLLWEKGHDVLLEAAVHAHRRNPALKIILIGSGSRGARREMPEKIKALGLEETVRYLGFRRDVARVVSQSDFLVMSSRTEAFPLALLEAATLGKTAAATACGGPSEIIVEGETGLLVPVGDAPALCDAMLRLADDAYTRQKMGAAARQRVEENFSIEQYVEKFASLYEEVAGTEKAPLPSPRLARDLMRRYKSVQDINMEQFRFLLLLLLQPFKLLRRARHGKSDI